MTNEEPNKTKAVQISGDDIEAVAKAIYNSYWQGNDKWQDATDNERAMNVDMSKAAITAMIERGWEAKGEIRIERKMLRLPQSIFNEAAKPPYAHLFAMTDLGNMLFKVMEDAGLKPQFRAAIDDKPIAFFGIEVNVATETIPKQLLKPW